MTRLEELESAIEHIPDEYANSRTILLKLLYNGELECAQIYTAGLLDMAYHLTSDEELLEPLRSIRMLLG